MLKALLLALFAIPSSSAVITCRTACLQCREKLEHPEMLEVYCAMCRECKERRSEWLLDAPHKGNVRENFQILEDHEDQDDDCLPTTPIEESCEEPIETTTTTTTPTTTTTTTTKATTTRRPCPPKTTPCRKPKPTCMGAPCMPMFPIGIPMCPMCPIMPSINPNFPSPSASPSTIPSTFTTISSTAETMFFYLGVPKKLLNEIRAGTVNLIKQ